MRKLLLLLCLISVPAFAEPPEINMKTVLMNDATGKPFPNEAVIPHTDLTLGSAIALSECVPGDRDANGREIMQETALAKAKRCAFGISIESDEHAKLTGPQVTQIEDVLKNWAPSVLVKIIPLIDPAQDLLK